MARFIVRVQLTENSKYEALHEEMEVDGFKRTIRPAAETTEYHLPEATYYYVTDNDFTSASEVVLQAYRAGLRAHPTGAPKVVAVKAGSGPGDIAELGLVSA